MIWIVLGIVAVVIFYVIGTYNGLVVLRNRVKNQWAQIDVHLKKRFDLIPNLVETVKGYAAHEKETFESVIAARNQFSDAKTPEEEMNASNALTGAIGRLFAVAEAYPELKANENFMDLQRQLAEVEEKIAYARQFYNDAVLKLNNKCEVFPSNVVANMFHIEQAKFFEVEEAAKEAPKVQF